MSCRVLSCTEPPDGNVLCRKHWLLVPKPLRDEYERAWHAAGGFRRFGMTARGYLALRDCIASALILTGQQTVEDVISERRIWERIASGYDEERAERMARAPKKASAQADVDD